MLGNLGSDGSGAVTEFVLEAPPFVGFVKRECTDGGGGDPSVNHLIVVDSSGGLPAHSCDYIRGGECTGASSDLDDDILQGISPGSPILYLLYSSEDGYCVKEDEHRAIFDAAVRCLWADDPFAVVRAADRGQTGAQPLVSVDVDERGEIVFGGNAAYTGWAKGGGPSIVAGPGGSESALLFEPGRWLQLGESGVEISGDWSMPCRIHVAAEALQSIGADSVLLLVAAEVTDTVNVGTSLLATAGGWSTLTVHSLQAEGVERRTTFLDGVQMVQYDRALKICDGAPCLASFVTVGTESQPLPFAIQQLRLMPGLVDPNTTLSDSVIPYRAENSRWLEISRGLDGVEIRWDTIGWEQATHEQVAVSLDPAGGITVTARNMSVLWDRAVASAGGVANDRAAAANWTSATLNITGALGLHVGYVDSDPCFDLW
eukprot:SAG22_NODE_31_length_27697_cov_7.384376_20_plen_430_part_00